ncbi:MAG: RNA polymerase sigma factor [Solirubrobacterales bacterium]
MKFTDAYEEHFWSVYGFHGYRLRSKGETEDLTQETFERALKAWHRFDPDRGELRPWLLRIARNTYIDYRRRQGSRPRIAADSLDEMGDPPELPTGAEIALDPALAKALSQLSTREREAIALRFGGDLRTADVAQVLGVSTANAQQILSRALRRLRSILEPEQRPE